MSDALPYIKLACTVQLYYCYEAGWTRENEHRPAFPLCSTTALQIASQNAALESVGIDWNSLELLGCPGGCAVIHWNMLELIGTDR